MEEIALDLFHHLGWPFFLLVVGVIADGATTQDLKMGIAKRIQNAQPITTLNESAQLYRYGLLERLLGPNVLSWRFLISSALISIVVLFLVILIQSYKFHGSMAATFAMTNAAQIAIAFTLVLTAIVIDYISNIATLSILRTSVGSSSTSGIDVLTAFLANLALNTSIFTFIFPIGIVASTFMVGLYVPDYLTTKIAPAVIHGLPSSYQLTGTHAINYGVSYFAFNPAGVPVIAPDETSILAVVGKRGSSPHDSVSDVATLLSADQTQNLILGNEAEFPMRRKHSARLQWLAALYVASFVEVDSIKNNVPGLVSLQPLAVRLSSLYREARQRYSSSAEALVKCSPGLTARVYYQAGNMNSLALAANRKCAGSFERAVTGTLGADISTAVLSAITGYNLIPITPYFLASFTITILYYLGLFITVGGLHVISLISRLFRINGLRTKDLPFTVLGTVTAVPIWLLWWVSFHI